MRFLLDTVVLSEAARPRGDPAVNRWVSARHPDDLCTSVLCVGELQRGVARLPEGESRLRLERWLEEAVAGLGGRILPVSLDVARRWGQLFGRLENSGGRPPVTDSLIAATALAHGLSVVTRNVGDFERCGVEVVNPWLS